MEKMLLEDDLIRNVIANIKKEGYNQINISGVYAVGYSPSMTDANALVHLGGRYELLERQIQQVITRKPFQIALSDIVSKKLMSVPIDNDNGLVRYARLHVDGLTLTARLERVQIKQGTHCMVDIDEDNVIINEDLPEETQEMLSKLMPIL
jgi:hypothetical protein